MKEWLQRLKKLDEQSNESECKAIFAFMDRNKDYLIDKTDFILFSTMKYDNAEIEKHQQILLKILQNQS